MQGSQNATVMKTADKHVNITRTFARQLPVIRIEEMLETMFSVGSAAVAI
jgi:hypothetical protein